jgi:FKBP-type peptidyl-prolyl cis-trans isomerase FklB
MQKTVWFVCQLLAAGMLLLGMASAQQTPASSPQPSSAQPSSAQPSAQTSQAASGQSASQSPAKKTTTPAHKVPPRATTALALKTQKDKASYALGMKIGGDLRRQGANEALDAAIAARGFKDALSGSKTAMTEDEQRSALMQLQNQVREKQQAKAHEEGAAARKTGEDFLASNKSKDGVVTLPSGLQYKILTAGAGPKPTATDTVTCNYKGTLLNGKEFDSSYKRGHPESFPVGGVIKGWTEALQLMPVGSKWQLWIPADLGYGDHGAGSDIGPGETLVFEVELLSIGEEKKQ